MTGITITTNPPFRDVLGRFVRADKEMIDAKREEMRNLGRRWVEIARQIAPLGKTGKFRKSINYRTTTSGSTVELTTFSAQPLGKFIREGTKPHPIAARNAGALYFFFPKIGMFLVVPKGGGFKSHVRGGALWSGKGHVDHPSTKANDYVARATTQWMPEADAVLRRIGNRYVERLVK